MEIADLKSFYQNKKVFLTGHTGFKGSWMISLLNYFGADVKGYALAAEGETNLFDQIGGDSMCESVIADIRNTQILKEAILSFEPDYIFHMAAQSLVLESYNDPINTIDVNCMGTAHLLEAARSLERPCDIIVITTDKVYKNKEWIHPYRENDELGGLDPYSASKAMTEMVVHTYAHSYFNVNKYDSHNKTVSSVRAGNVIGGGDWAENRIIPDIIRAISSNLPVVLRNPHSVRPWQHVLDPLMGYLSLAKRLRDNRLRYVGAYNFGPTDFMSMTVEELTKKAIDVWGAGTYEIQGEVEKDHEAKLLTLDSTKAVHELGWKPKWSSAEAVENTIKWYKEVELNNGDPLEVTQMQIANYFAS